MEYDYEVFDGKPFSHLVKDLHNSVEQRRAQIYKIIDDFRPLIKSINDATMLAPLIRDYLDTAIKNDDQLNKLYAIVQRHLALSVKTTESGDEPFFSEEDKQKLLKDINSVITDEKVIDKNMDDLKESSKLSIEKELDAL